MVNVVTGGNKTKHTFPSVPVSVHFVVMVACEKSITIRLNVARKQQTPTVWLRHQECLKSLITCGAGERWQSLALFACNSPINYTLSVRRIFLVLLVHSRPVALSTRSLLAAFVALVIAIVIEWFVDSTFCANFARHLNSP